MIIGFKEIMYKLHIVVHSKVTMNGYGMILVIYVPYYVPYTSIYHSHYPMFGKVNIQQLPSLRTDR